MKIKTSELTGIALDWAVSLVTNPEWTEEDRRYNTIDYIDTGDAYDEPYSPSTNWAQGGPIIEREGIATFLDWERFIIPGERSRFGGVAWGQKPGTVWGAVRGEYYMADPSGNSPTGDNYMEGSTPLIAAMRCYVASKLGDEVEVPYELR